MIKGGIVNHLVDIIEKLDTMKNQDDDLESAMFAAIRVLSNVLEPGILK